jgi:hypothetical protein
MERTEPVAAPADGRWERLQERAAALHHRYARAFWTAHSIWALLSGAMVLVLAHNRYGYLPWVVAFLGLTWASTLFFSRFARVATASRAGRLASGFVSYLTRIMYQSTLFFLLPFYFYSTTFPSWNSAYVVALAALAVFSCFDIPFDRLLRSSRAFALAFFGIVTFSALQFFVPLVLAVPVHFGAYIAAAASLLAAVPMAHPWRELRRRATLARLALAMLLALGAVRMLRPAIPPVPLRLSRVRFAAALDPRTIRAVQEYTDTVSRSALAEGRLYAVATVFAPSRLPAAITLRFVRDGEVLRTSRTVNLVAHSRGFRVWDVMRSGKGGFGPGRYVLEVWTGEGQLVGRSAIAVVEDERANRPLRAP